MERTGKMSQLRKRIARNILVGAAGILLPLHFADAQDKKEVAPGTAVTITTTAAAPPVSISLLERAAYAKPDKGAHDHTGAGNIDVQSPTADTVTVTFAGVAVANSGFSFDLSQCFEVSFDDPKVKKAKLTIEGRVIGLLRGEKKGHAEETGAAASLCAASTDIITIALPSHSVGECESLSINDHEGPKTVPITAGKYTLHQTWHILAHSDSFFHKKPSAEFAPDPALDPLWISYWEPFHGAAKKDFGFQVTIKVADDTGTADDKKDEKKEEKKPEEVAPPKEEKKMDKDKEAAQLMPR